MTDKTMDNQWLLMWNTEDFYIQNSVQSGVTILSEQGTVKDCMRRCFVRSKCIGFTREKGILALYSEAMCWAVLRIPPAPIHNHSVWMTFVFTPSLQSELE